MADANQDGLVSIEEYMLKAMEIAEKEKQDMETDARSNNTENVENNEEPTAEKTEGQ
jgi:hypothetical protein